jgi:hypothetical protein
MMTTATAGTLRAETRLVLEGIRGRLTAVRVPFRSIFSTLQSAAAAVDIVLRTCFHLLLPPVLIVLAQVEQ